MKILTPIDMKQLEIQNVRLQNLATVPASPAEGQIFYDSSASFKRPRVWNGTGWYVLGYIQSVSGTAPVTATVSASGVLTIGINAASASNAGSMSASHYALVAGATAANTQSTVVMRDTNGDFSAGTISAALNGTASIATVALNLGTAGQDAAYMRNRSNHTGTQLANSISDLATVVKAYRLDEFAMPTGALTLNNQRITNIAEPVNDNDAATKSYVDASRVGLDWKDSARVTTTGSNITLTGGAPSTLDSVVLVAGDRILVKDQTNKAQNGLYVVDTLGTGANGTWVRSADADANEDVSTGMFVFIDEGTNYSSSSWVLSTTGTINLGTTELTFTQYSQAGSITATNVGTAGVGVFKQRTGSTIEFKKIRGTTNAISVTDNTTESTVDIALTPANIDANTLGGTLGVSKGGTGGTDAATARVNLGITGGRKYTQAIGDGSATSFAITHNLGTRDITVSITEAASPYSIVYADVECTDTNTATARFAIAPTTGQYRVTVLG